MKPTKGRIVFYQPYGIVESEPAIIQKVRDNGNVDLFVFSPGGVYLARNVVEGEKEAQWSWPPRV